MGRLSKIQKAEIAAKQTEAARNLSEALTVSAKVVIEEGLYIALMVDLWVVTGRVKVYEDGTTVKTMWAVQREIMADTIHAITVMADQEIPLTNIAPLKWMANLTASWEAELRDGEDIEGVIYYKKIDTIIRAIMVLMLPGMLRMVVTMTRQLIQLVK
jgi:hypothetical protein